jgi:hypothetical protein
VFLGLSAVLVAVLIGVWWFAGGPGSYQHTPVLAGQEQAAARTTLTGLGLTGQVRTAYSSAVPSGRVISSTPGAGAKVKKHGTVVLTVSAGPQPVPIPNVAGMTVDNATAALKALNLSVGSTSARYVSGPETGAVISTTPSIGSRLAPGHAVNLVVSGGGMMKGVLSGLCIGVTGGSTNDGTLTELEQCDGSTSQSWTWTATQQLTVDGGTKCLDVSGEGTGDGTPVQIWDCSGNSNQQWTINADGSIVGAGSGKCLDATNQGTTPGTPIQIWDCSGIPNQQWTRG